MPDQPKPNSLIVKANAQIQIKKYRDEKWHLLSNSIRKSETRSVFFTKAQIQEWWEEILYQETVGPKEVTGLRIYLACFPDNHPKYSKQINLITILTKLADNGDNEDFFIEEQPGFDDRPVAAISGVGLDHGIPCPPDCDGEHDPY